MIDKVEKLQCSGCSACANACPVTAIKMQSDDEGFQYPKINYDSCINCNLCERICPVLAGQKRYAERLAEPKAKAAWTRNPEVRFMSTSGGLFTELARAFLKEDGFVAGAIYNDKFQVEHCLTDNIAGIEKLRQSKYVQSNKKDIFKQVSAKLKQDQRVLFVGAPCEVGGLYNFLGKDYSQLITIDYICLGANSPKIYNSFLEMLRQQYHSEITRVWFKNKEKGWNSFCTRVDFANGKCYLKNRRHDYFMRGYIGRKKYYTRPACTRCRYKTIPRQADITLADFWGIANLDPKLDEDLGTSAVLLNSKKGCELYAEAESAIYSYDMTFSDIAKGNKALTNSVHLADDRADFFAKLDKVSFDVLINEFCQKGWREKIADLKADVGLIFGKKARI